MHKAIKGLEARALIEDTGNYEPDEVDDIIAIYKDVVKRVGFEDKRRDKRFVVKFHDVFYTLPDGYYEAQTEHVDNLFNMFCEMQYGHIKEEAMCLDIDIQDMLTRLPVGSYNAFKLDIPNITENNAAQIAMSIYDEFPYTEHYIDKHIHIMKLLQSLENNYMDDWIEFLQNEVEAGNFEKHVLKQIENNYNKLKKGKLYAKS